MRRRASFVSLVAFVGLSLTPLAGQSISLTGDQTIVLLTSQPALTAASITLSATGNAVLGTDLATRPEVLLPITGGDFDETTLSGTIEHAGSGVRLNDGGGASVDLADLVIDFDALLVTSNVSVNGGAPGSVGIFDVAACSDLYGGAGQCLDGDGSILLDGWKLSVTAELAAALDEAFGLTDLTGAQAGVARIDIRPLPEPGAAVLLGLGAIALALRGRASALR